MKISKVYVVRIQARNEWSMRNSDEAYFTLEKAQKFVENRSDEPTPISPYFYESSAYQYYIDELLISR